MIAAGATPTRTLTNCIRAPRQPTVASSSKFVDSPKDKKVKRFRVIVSTDKTEYVAPNDWSQDSTHDTPQVGAVRWQIEQFQREVKQTTGMEACQCLKQQIPRNHIACALLVWTRLRQLAEAMGTTVYWSITLSITLWALPVAPHVAR